MQYLSFSENYQKMHHTFMKSGFNGFNEHEVLEFVLYDKLSEQTRKQTVHNLLEKFGSLKQLFMASYEQLIQVDGINKMTATYILFLRELYLIYENHAFEKICLCSMEKRKLYFVEKLGMEVDEVLYIVCLDEKMNVIHGGEIARGSAGAVEIDLEKMMKIVQSVPCHHVMISHNHPQGFARFSRQDVLTTQYLKEYLHQSGIELVDHILVAGGRAISMQDCAEM